MSLRLSALLLGAALTVPMTAKAATAPAKPAAPAERQILLQADAVDYDGDNQTVAAVGHVEIVDEGSILDADRVTYDQKTDKVTADGHVSLTDRLGNVANPEQAAERSKPQAFFAPIRS
jgi:LPS-assembly protein